MIRNKFTCFVGTHAPTILNALGIAAFIGGTIAAYKCSDKTKEASKAHEEKVEEIKNSDMSKKDKRKATVKENVKYTGAVAKSQWPTIALDVAGTGLVTAGSIMSEKRLSNALEKCAAYAATIGAANLKGMLDNHNVKDSKIEESAEEKSEEIEEKNELCWLPVTLNYENCCFWRAGKGSRTYLINHLSMVESSYLDMYLRDGWYDLYSICDTYGVTDCVVEELKSKYGLGENFLRDHGLVAPDYNDPDTDRTIINDSLDVVEYLNKIRPGVSLFNITYEDKKGVRKLFEDTTDADNPGYIAPSDDIYGTDGQITIYIPYESKALNGRRPENFKPIRIE